MYFDHEGLQSPLALQECLPVRIKNGFYRKAGFRTQGICFVNMEQKLLQINTWREDRQKENHKTVMNTYRKKTNTNTQMIETGWPQ